MKIRILHVAGTLAGVATAAVALAAPALSSTPTKPAADHIRHATGATVVVYRHAHGSVRKSVGGTLSAGQARRLAHVINTEPLFPRGAFACPRGLVHTYDVVHFRTKSGPVKALVSPTGCPVVRLTVDGTQQPALEGGGTVDAMILKDLGLPKDYGLQGGYV